MLTGIETEGRSQDSDREEDLSLHTSGDERLPYAHAHELWLAYERGREDSSAFPALLCGILMGAASVAITAWVL